MRGGEGKRKEGGGVDEIRIGFRGQNSRSWRFGPEYAAGNGCGIDREVRLNFLQS